MEIIQPYFTCIPLGVKGGLDESNLPSFMIAPKNSKSFICLDAGTLMAGLRVAHQKGCFEDFEYPADSNLSIEGYILHHHVKAYFITHPYLDHIQGLINISPNDNQKYIYGLAGTIEEMQNHLFNWRIWPNLCDKGIEPTLQYNYVALNPGKSLPIDGTTMTVRAFSLAHGKYTDSTAFLLEANEHYILYMGDTGPDEVENRSTTRDLWRHIAPLVKEKKLHGIFIESSYSDDRPDELLYSHLTPSWIMKAFHEMALLLDQENASKALIGLNVIIIHIKPNLKSGTPVHEIVEHQLKQRNNLGLNIFFATQGERFDI